MITQTTKTFVNGMSRECKIFLTLHFALGEVWRLCYTTGVFDSWFHALNVMTKEMRIFVFATVLPVLLGTVAAVFSVRTAWQKMLDDEQRDLNTHAGLMADALMSRVHAVHSPGPPPHGDPDLSHHPPPPRHPPSPRHPPPPRHRHRHLEGPGRSNLSAKDVAPLCADLREDGRLSGIAFEIRDFDGIRFFATDDWPARHDMTGQCNLGPPLGGKTLVAARTDGGADLHFRVMILFATAGIGSLFIIATFLVGSLLLVRTVSRERHDARRKADFFDNISHELKTPLAGIRLNAELLSKDRIPDAELRKGALDAIIVESDRLGKMVDELLDFSRLDKGSRRYNLETFDLADFARDPAEVQCAAGASQGRAKVRVVGPGKLVVADKDAFRQIGVILVSNALKYAEGDIDIEVEGNVARYMDRGPGIPRGDEERIFERFYRCDSSLASKTSGSGLGLAIARALARGMGGDLTYSRRPGGGSVFTLKLKEA